MYFSKNFLRSIWNVRVFDFSNLNGGALALKKKKCIVPPLRSNNQHIKIAEHRSTDIVMPCCATSGYLVLVILPVARLNARLSLYSIVTYLSVVIIESEPAASLQPSQPERQLDSWNLLAFGTLDFNVPVGPLDNIADTSVTFWASDYHFRFKRYFIHMPQTFRYAAVSGKISSKLS